MFCSLSAHAFCGGVLQDRRLDLFLSATVAAMHSQQNYYKATEIALTRLIGMAKNNIPMRQWIFARRATLRWMADWLRVNVRPPAYYAVRYSWRIASVLGG
jgi:hypothetical protein